MGIRFTLTLTACMLALACGAPRSASALPAVAPSQVASAEASGAGLVDKVHCRRGGCRPCDGCDYWLSRWYWKNNYDGPYLFFYRGWAYPYYPGYGYYRRFGR